MHDDGKYVPERAKAMRLMDEVFEKAMEAKKAEEKAEEESKADLRKRGFKV